LKKVFFSILVLVFLDLISKGLALKFLPPFHGLTYPFGGVGLGTFFGCSLSLNLVGNTGVAWGLFPGHPLLLLIVRVSIIVALIAYLLCQRNRRIPFPFFLIIAGAIGNVIDLIFYRHVIDFIHFRFWGWSFPIFNLADSWITLGALFLFICPQSNVMKQRNG
jgi:signal peptidase II